jgi:alkanesulfonate monooxygenase SsuD/methylene tetrahydromethanopterin reductase-like flavin-dependent oxidoreductase (luciferase family)
VQCVRLLLREEVSNFDGKYFQLKEARCEPRPVQAELPIWVGGGGEKRTLAIVARWADGWNVPFISPEEFARKRDVLAGHCAAAGRDVDDIKCAVNVGLAFTDESLKTQFGALADAIRPGVLTGSDDEVVDTVGRYAEAGATQINVALRAPFLTAELERLAPAIQQIG